MVIRIQDQAWKIRQDHCHRVAGVLDKKTRQGTEHREQNNIPYTTT